jgi:glycosyltransferase involved in cell wall biosynthesis
MKKAIIIPIYLRLSKAEELPYSEGLTLAKRAIESLNLLEDQDFTLILPVALDLNEEDKEGALGEASRLLREEVRHFCHGRRVLVLSSYHLRSLREYLAQMDFKKFHLLIDLKGFSKIRNTGLLLAQGLSMDVAIFIDNDEVVEDPRYLKVACEYLNQERDGTVVLGKGGFYVNPDGTILLPPQRLWWRCLWNKTKWMNRVWEEILSSEDRLVPSPMLLGGNLVLHRHLFHSVPFDPYIPRGEDTDYLINATQLGFCILFDKQLRIKHLHPERTKVYFHEELKGDVERFLYERQKAKRGFSINLDPYPGYFLKWTLYPKALLTSLLLALDYLWKKEWEKAREGIFNMGLLFQERNGGWLKYLQFRGDWEKAMEKIEKEGMDSVLKNCWV